MLMEIYVCLLKCPQKTQRNPSNIRYKNFRPSFSILIRDAQATSPGQTWKMSIYLHKQIFFHLRFYPEARKFRKNVNCDKKANHANNTIFISITTLIPLLYHMVSKRKLFLTLKTNLHKFSFTTTVYYKLHKIATCSAI